MRSAKFFLQFRPEADCDNANTDHDQQSGHRVNEKYGMGGPPEGATRSASVDTDLFGFLLLGF